MGNQRVIDLAACDKYNRALRKYNLRTNQFDPMSGRGAEDPHTVLPAGVVVGPVRAVDLPHRVRHLVLTSTWQHDGTHSVRRQSGYLTRLSRHHYWVGNTLRSWGRISIAEIWKSFCIHGWRAKKKLFTESQFFKDLYELNNNKGNSGCNDSVPRVYMYACRADVGRRCSHWPSLQSRMFSCSVKPLWHAHW